MRGGFLASAEDEKNSLTGAPVRDGPGKREKGVGSR